MTTRRTLGSAARAALAAGVALGLAAYAAPVDSDTLAGFTLGSGAFTGAMDELRLRAGVRGPADFLYAAPPRCTILVVR